MTTTATLSLTERELYEIKEKAVKETRLKLLFHHSIFPRFKHLYGAVNKLRFEADTENDKYRGGNAFKHFRISGEKVHGEKVEKKVRIKADFLKNYLEEGSNDFPKGFIYDGLD